MQRQMTILSLLRIPRRKIVARTIEAILTSLLVAMAIDRLAAGDGAAAVSNVIGATALVGLAEGLLWGIPRLIDWADTTWGISSDEVLLRGVQLIIITFMVADAAVWLTTGEGFGVNQGGCLFFVGGLEAIIRGVVRPDPPQVLMARALQQAQARVRVFTHLPPGRVRETLGLVRGISDIEAGSRLEFELAEQEALYLMLKQALALGANAVIDARLTTATYETSGSGWQVSRPVYTGTAVRL
jgi:uncharacterized protein YbjQ (UPF0145 family)